MRSSQLFSPFLALVILTASGGCASSPRGTSTPSGSPLACVRPLEEWCTFRPCDAHDAARARLVADEKVGRLESATCGTHRLLTAYIFVRAETLYFDERGALVGAAAVSDAPVPECGGEFSTTFGHVPECGNGTGAREVVKP